MHGIYSVFGFSLTAFVNVWKGTYILITYILYIYNRESMCPLWFVDIKSVWWSRKQCLTDLSNFQIFHALQTHRAIYRKNRLYSIYIYINIYIYIYIHIYIYIYIYIHIHIYILWEEKRTRLYIYTYMPRKKIQPDDEELNRDFQF